ncbi:MAG: serine/threonine-protein kinase [Minicystis sp.]
MADMKSLRLQPDTIFAGRYRVIRLLGQGSMGSVYLVEEAPGGALRALKVMSPDLLHDAIFVARFTQEAQVSRGIASKHVVAVVASGVDETYQLPWFAMEHLEGLDLTQWLDARPPLERAMAVALLAQLFDAMSAAHDAAVVHRDLRPDNIFVAQQGGRPTLKVLDFGVAKVVRESTAGGTAPGLGAPLWAAPEQATRGPILPSADVWALGLIAFRLLTGKMFWKSANIESASPLEIALELLRIPIPSASSRAREIEVEDRLPSGFDAWFAKAVVRDRSQRFPTARAAWGALAPLLARG